MAIDDLMNPIVTGEASYFESLQPQQKARLLYAQGQPLVNIAKFLGVKYNLVQRWKAADDWQKADIFDDMTIAIRARFISVIFREDKSHADYAEMDALVRLVEKSARIERYRKTGNEDDLNPTGRGKYDKDKAKKKVKNYLTPEQTALLIEQFEQIFFPFQKEWGTAVEQGRIFALLKSRQIGATYFFALWALIDLLKTGKNKIFLSASKAQAYQFIEYIKAFILEHTEVEVKGEPLVINTETTQATFYWLGTNALTAQGRHGDVIMDEFFWIRSFNTFRKVAAAMASQKMYRQVYLSTPSSITHEAYPFWAGTDTKRKVEIDISKAALTKPTRCVDRKIRQIMPLRLAEKLGYDRFDRADLEAEYTEEEFKNLFDCEFIDDSGSYFPMSILEGNMIDSWEVWKDYHPFSPEPYKGEVWLGYDPSFTGDNAALVVIAPPKTNLSPYRILEVQQFKHLTSSEQALKIKKVIDRYHVTFVGIDNTGNGLSVCEHVAQFYPALKRLNYNPDLKIRMGLRAKELFERRRLQFDAGKIEIAKAFLSIKKAMTAGQTAKTLITTRSADTGHGDVAWAVMNALEKAPVIDSVESNGATTQRIRVFK